MDTEEDRRERARTLAQDAVAEYSKGEQAKGDKLAEEAVKTDRQAVKDVVRELEADAKAAGVAPRPGAPAG